jgi:hypothetical protein
MAHHRDLFVFTYGAEVEMMIMMIVEQLVE